MYFCLLTGKQFLYNYPKFYAHNLPADFVRDNPNVLHAIDGSRVEQAPWNNSLTLTSSAGQQFLSFAKYTDYGQGESISLLCGPPQGGFITRYTPPVCLFIPCQPLTRKWNTVQRSDFDGSLPT